MFKRSEPISATDILNEFGSNQTGGLFHLSDYYAGGGLIEAGERRNVTPEQAALDGIAYNAVVPSSGAISFSNLYGITKTIPFTVSIPDYTVTGNGDGGIITAHVGFTKGVDGVITWRIWTPDGTEPEQTGTISIGLDNVEMKLSLSGFTNGTGTQYLVGDTHPTSTNVHQPDFTQWGVSKPKRFMMGEWFEPRYGLERVVTLYAVGGEAISTKSFTLEVRQVDKPANVVSDSFDVVMDNSIAVNAHVPSYRYSDGVFKGNTANTVLYIWNDKDDDTKHYMQWRNGHSGETVVWDSNKDVTSDDVLFLGTNTGIEVTSVSAGVTFTHDLNKTLKIKDDSLDEPDGAMRLTFTGNDTTHAVSFTLENDEDGKRDLTLTVDTKNQYNICNDVTEAANNVWTDVGLYTSVSDVSHVRSDGVPPQVDIVLVKTAVTGGYDLNIKVVKDGSPSTDIKLNSSPIECDTLYRVLVGSGLNAIFHDSSEEGMWYNVGTDESVYLVRSVQQDDFTSNVFSGSIYLRPIGSMIPTLDVPFSIDVENAHKPTPIPYDSLPTDVTYTRSQYGIQETGIGIEKIVGDYYWKRTYNGQVQSLDKIGGFHQTGLECKISEISGNVNININENEWVDIEGDGGIILSVASEITNSVTSGGMKIEFRPKVVPNGMDVIIGSSTVNITASNTSTVATWYQLPDTQYHTYVSIPMSNQFIIETDATNVYFQAGYDVTQIRDKVKMAEGDLEMFLEVDGMSGDLVTVGWTPNVWVELSEHTTYVAQVTTSIYKKFAQGNARLIIRDLTSKEVKYDHRLLLTATLA
ncbi:hypothetical protein MYOV003v1_p0129 [Vibrio phage 207E48.1]|nr:hypothetical protein MYOV003v1_p0129 [Vibrio phage 207E48.1]